MKRLWRDSLLVGTLPADASTPTGRSRERFRRIGLTTASSIAARGISFATSLITVPLTLHYLGTERYGLWATLSSIIAGKLRGSWRGGGSYPRADLRAPYPNLPCPS